MMTLADRAFTHSITRQDNTKGTPKPTLYLYNAITSFWYDNSEFKGILVDSRVATRSSGGLSQLEALQQLDSTIKLDKTSAGSADFIFEIGSTSAVGTVSLKTPMRIIIFYIVQAAIPFLLCLANMDRLGVYFNNIQNTLVQETKHHSVVRKYGHAFLTWFTSVFNIAVKSISMNPCYLTNVELRCLH